MRLFTDVDVTTIEEDHGRCVGWQRRLAMMGGRWRCRPAGFKSTQFPSRPKCLVHLAPLFDVNLAPSSFNTWNTRSSMFISVAPGQEGDGVREGTAMHGFLSYTSDSLHKTWSGRPSRDAICQRAPFFWQLNDMTRRITRNKQREKERIGHLNVKWLGITNCFLLLPFRCVVWSCLTTCSFTAFLPPSHPRQTTHSHKERNRC